MSDWHRAVARVTTAQLCRAAGIDRSSRQALDCLNDVLIKHLLFVATTAAQAAELRGRSISFEDAILVLTECQVVGARLPDEDAQDLEEFLEWIRGPANQRALHSARMQRFQMNTLGLAPPASAGAAMLPASVPGLVPPPPGIPPVVPQSIPSQAQIQPLQALQAPPQQAGQAYLPPLPFPVLPPRSSGPALENGSAMPNDPSRQLQRDDWVKSLVKQQILMGHEKRFNATEFGSPAQNEMLIEGGPATIEEFYAQEVK